MLYTKPLWMKKLLPLVVTIMAILYGKTMVLMKNCFTKLILSHLCLLMILKGNLFNLLFILSPSINALIALIWNFTTKFNTKCQSRKLQKLGRVSEINMDTPEMVLEVEAWKLV
jgi:hypothetical protein